MRFNVLVLTGCVCVGLMAGRAGAQPGPQGGIYSKPYVIGDSKVRVGGYADMEFIYDLPADAAQSNANTFDQHRLIPFMFAEVTDAMTFSTEIEYEHGGNVEQDGQIKIEYMVIDYRIVDPFQVRAGIVLSPLGRFNLLHDSPLNDLTDRPLVSRYIIPTTLSESGAGLFGVIYPSDMAVFNYEVYLVNGFDEGIIVDSLGTVRVRQGRGSVKQDNNQNKSLVTRLSYSPRLGMEIGLSAHHGKYDDVGTDHLTIVAVDAEFRRGPIELLLEMAQSATERAHLGLSRQTQFGFYLQGNYHFLQDKLLNGSTFTGVFRWDWVDFGKKGDPDDKLSRLTVGVNFRPVERAAFKLDFQTNWQQAPGLSNTRQDHRVLASVATYF